MQRVAKVGRNGLRVFGLGYLATEVIKHAKQRQTSHPLNAVTSAGKLSEEAFLRKKAIFETFAKKHDVDIRVSPTAKAQYDGLLDVIEIGRIFEESEESLEWTLFHELRHRQIEKPLQPLFVFVTGLLVSNMHQIVVSKKVPLACLGILSGGIGTILAYKYIGEVLADEYANCNSSTIALVAAKKTFEDYAVDGYPFVPWYSRLVDVHPHPIKRIANIEATLQKRKSAAETPINEE